MDIMWVIIAVVTVLLIEDQITDWIEPGKGDKDGR